MYVTPKVGFVEAYKYFWLNYFNFKGRSRRSEYWWVALWNFLIYVVTFFLAFLCFFIPGVGPILGVILIIVILLYALATIIPNLALQVRRFHDVGFSMWIPMISFIVSIIYNVISGLSPDEDISEGNINGVDTKVTGNLNFDFIPDWLGYTVLSLTIILNIVCLIIALLDSKEQVNKYGPSPKYIETGHDKGFPNDDLKDDASNEESFTSYETSQQKQIEQDPYKY
ncbi:hypothetical protein SSCHL_0567 [Staphylococcus schleiferi]|uniref:DUF805 domain-containing protein n=1 Tax=Staphylococcus coagulans TaxID=74706 RepID=UPI0006BDDEF2|nr:DUF805 domain-containing protein [Staphylococcus coagulans]PNZ10808.1 DUF805 domain-containing protein [Staphylococcus coagulans]BAS45347.1 hypothetical protein SSCHL_0567 [Staphylococcus schleiferi]